MKGSDRGKISGAPPAPGDAMQGAARKAGWRPADKPQHGSAPRARRPSGLPLGRASSLSALVCVPPARLPRAFANLLRPSGQRAESLPVARASGAKANEGRCGAYRMREPTKPGARPAPSLRARAAGRAWLCWPPLKGHHPSCGRPSGGSDPQGSLARRQRPGMRCKARRGGQGGALPTRRNTAARPWRGGPSGCRWAGHLHCRRSSACCLHACLAPSQICFGLAGNAPRALGSPNPNPARPAPRARPSPICG